MIDVRLVDPEHVPETDANRLERNMANEDDHHPANADLGKYHVRDSHGNKGRDRESDRHEHGMQPTKLRELAARRIREPIDCDDHDECGDRAEEHAALIARDCAVSCDEHGAREQEHDGEH